MLYLLPHLHKQQHFIEPDESCYIRVEFFPAKLSGNRRG